MKKIIKVCLVTALILGVIGLGFVGIGFIGNGFTLGINNMQSAFNVPLQNKYEFDGKEIKNIDASIEAGKLIIKEGDKDNIHVEIFDKVANRRSIDVEQKGDILKIDESDDVLFNKSFRTNRVEVILYLPKDIELEEVKLDADAGKIEAYKLLVRDKLEVEVDAGDITLSNIQAPFIDASCDAGNISMDVIDVDRMNLECNLGNIYGKINRNVSDFNYKMECNVGSIKINDRGYREYSNNAVSKNIIEAECNVGSIELYLEEE